MSKLSKILSLATAPIARNPEYCVFMYALCMVSALCTVKYEWKQELYGYAWCETWVWVYVTAALLSLLPLAARRIVRGVIYAVCYTVSIVDVYCFVKFDSALNPSILMLMGETDTREAGEFLSQYVTADILATNVGWVLLVLLLHIVWSIMRVSGVPHILRRISGAVTAFLSRRRIWLAVPVATATAVCLVLSLDNLKAMHTLLSLQNIGDVEHRLTEKKHGEQFLPLYRAVFSIYANRLTAKQVDVLRKVAETVVTDSCTFRSPEIVFIIGEAYSKRHSQLYGYALPTTPRQAEMRRRGELVPFTDVISPWNLTSFVFKHIMSTYAVGDKGDWCDYPLFCQVFRKAGYHVTFLTNEFLPQPKQQVFDFSGGFFLNDPQLSSLQFDRRNTRLHVFDAELLADYRMIEEEREADGDTLQKGNLTVFHLIGQHQEYRLRCPNSRRKFTVEDYADRTDLTNPRWKRNLCAYDNATLYNDSVVAAITAMFREKDAIVIYMPDHGEEVHSRELPHFFGRMHSTKIVKRLAREEFEIPFWIWASPAYRKQRPELWAEIRRSAALPYMTDAIPHLLFYLAGIHCPYYRPDLNILSPAYNAGRPRIIKRQVDYDVLMNE